MSEFAAELSDALAQQAALKKQHQREQAARRSDDRAAEDATAALKRAADPDGAETKTAIAKALARKKRRVPVILAAIAVLFADYQFFLFLWADEEERSDAAKWFGLGMFVAIVVVGLTCIGVILWYTLGRTKCPSCGGLSVVSNSRVPGFCEACGYGAAKARLAYRQLLADRAVQATEQPRFETWDVYFGFVEFVDSDDGEGKDRPVVIIKSDYDTKTATVLQMTSQEHRDGRPGFVRVSRDGWDQPGWSWVDVRSPRTLHWSQLRRYAGALTKRDVTSVMAALVKDEQRQ